jgi:hypothetical protein
MACKGNQIGADPEEEQVIFSVVFQNFFKTAEIIRDFLYEVLFRVIGQPKRCVRRTADASVDTGIPDFHSTTIGNRVFIAFLIFYWDFDVVIRRANFFASSTSSSFGLP